MTSECLLPPSPSPLPLCLVSLAVAAPCHHAPRPDSSPCQVLMTLFPHPTPAGLRVPIAPTVASPWVLCCASQLPYTFPHASVNSLTLASFHLSPFEYSHFPHRARWLLTSTAPHPHIVKVQGLREFLSSPKCPLNPGHGPIPERITVCHVFLLQSPR